MSCNRRCFFKVAGIGIPSLALSLSLPVKAGQQAPTATRPAIGSTGATPAFEPSYVSLHRKGILKQRAATLREMMRRCTLCPRDCKASRLDGQRGDCNAREFVEISSVTPHFGEERELVGRGGSGTIFFTNCSLLCVFCINYDISQLGKGQRQTVEFLADAMLRVQEWGCSNVNLVTPTHYSYHIMAALDIAAGRGLRLPLVYNTAGWEKREVLELLDGVVDVYLPDFKFYDSEAANRYSPGARCYPETTKAALLEIQRQVGVARPDPRTGLITRGMIIRHLVMPNNVAGSDKIMAWIGENLPKDTYVNIMSQYTPRFRAGDFREIARRVTREEFLRVVQAARAAGLTRFVAQGA